MEKRENKLGKVISGRYFLVRVRPIEDLDTDQIQLEGFEVVALPGGRTHLKFRVVK